MDNGNTTLFKESFDNLRKAYDQILSLEWNALAELDLSEQEKVQQELNHKISSVLSPFYKAAKQGIPPPIEELKKLHSEYEDKFIDAGSGLIKFSPLLFPFRVWSNMRLHFQKIGYEFLLTHYVQEGPCNCDLMLEARTGEKPSSDKLEKLQYNNNPGIIEETIYQCSYCKTKWIHYVNHDNPSSEAWLRHDL